MGMLKALRFKALKKAVIFLFLNKKYVLFLSFLTLFPGSSVVEQAAVNRLVGGSNPSRGAISQK